MSTKPRNSNPPANVRWARPLLMLCGLLLACRRTDGGTWTSVVEPAPNGVGVEHMLLLSDGTVMAQQVSGQNDTRSEWYRLTPVNGSYVNGHWTTLAPMNYTREFYSSAVLRDGRVFVAGGEYGTGGNTAEIFDPQNGPGGFWTPVPVPEALICTTCGSRGFSDSACAVLPDGKVLIAPVSPAAGNLATVIYDPVANTWSAGPTLQKQQNEATWVKLPDDSILTIDPNCCNPNFNPNELNTSERYIPSLNNGQGGWSNDGGLRLPVSMYNSASEIGPGLLLQDGRAFFIGGNGHTAFYTPTGNTSPGTWTAGPDVPGSGVGWDSPGAMLVNGKVLFMLNCSPVCYYEFDPNANPMTTANAYKNVSGWVDTSGVMHTMLTLPDGNVLVSFGNSSPRIYIPDGVPLPSGKPTISTITANANGSYRLTGTQLNGISQGSSLGDDRQMDSNYPLVRLTDSSSHIYYARTHDWSSTSVQTGNRAVSTEFDLPSGLTIPGSYSLEVVANGIASDPVPFSGPVWVAFGGSDPGIGTYDRPFNTLTRGRDAVAAGGQIFIKGPGSTPETLTISKAMRIYAVGGPATIGR